MSHTIFVPHGAGPLPLINQQDHQNMIQFMKESVKDITPGYIIVFSAHHETDGVHVIYDNSNELVYDYSGFPEKAYHLTFNPPKAIDLGEKIVALLQKNSIKATSSKRGFDHGVYVPLMLMYEKQDIPVIQISLNRSLDPSFHIRLGEVLGLLEENILFIGSGYSYHNMRGFFDNQIVDERNEEFHNWLVDTISNEMLETERTDLLVNFKNAPYATYAHPRTEHIIPLHICYGINKKAGKVVFDDTIYNKRTIGVIW
jgi:aromatic ring-opening dioxygenase catalytic subunit (LigB family)